MPGAPRVASLNPEAQKVGKQERSLGKQDFSGFPVGRRGFGEYNQGMIGDLKYFVLSLWFVFLQMRVQTLG